MSIAAKKFRIIARQAKAHLITFSKAHRPIIITGIRRGGSTMVADAIAVNKGVWNANEPFAVFPSHPALDLKRNLLPTREHSQFFDLDAAELLKFSHYVEGLLAARYPQLGSCGNTKFPLKADRVCLKILNAPWMTEWFSQETDAHILPLVRHPGAQAVSVLRQNWDFAAEAYARRMDRISHLFTTAQRDLIRDVLRGDDKWRIAVLDYAISTRIFFTKFADQIVKYEDIVADPHRFVDEVLIRRLGLPDRERMLQVLAKPSGSSRMSLDSLNAAIKKGDAKTILTAWRSQITPDMQISGQDIIDTFDIRIYSFFETSPVLDQTAQLSVKGIQS